MVAVAFFDDSSSAYGNARHHRLGDLTGDGATTTDDRNLLLGNSREYGVGDLDRDGEVTSNDLALLDTDMGAALSAGRLSSSGGTDNIVGYAGYIFNAELVSAGSTGLYTVRHRHYAPDLGRWLSRDPLGYVDGMSLYEYVRGRPTKYIDPMGEKAKAGEKCDCEDEGKCWCVAALQVALTPVGRHPDSLTTFEDANRFMRWWGRWMLLLDIGRGDIMSLAKSIAEGDAVGTTLTNARKAMESWNVNVWVKTETMCCERKTRWGLEQFVLWMVPVRKTEWRYESSTTWRKCSTGIGGDMFHQPSVEQLYGCIDDALTQCRNE